ncbi:MAG: spore cortex-lytic enzyme [Clostridiales bacterium]|jgi:N-acetylmuramoyl-L-alanine amidase|nr:spore cortex-lytic enzyme [Clostridiales bacterium]
MKKNYLKYIGIIMLVLSLVSASLYYNRFDNSVDVLSRRGSTGTEVKQIQTKLKTWGYYTGSIDGIYGAKTETAVKSFQKKNGLAVDGVAGKNTLAAMGISSSSSPVSSAGSGDIDMLARIIYGEARGESYTGQVAVAAVVLNRVKDSRFPKTIAGVIYQPGAFDAVNDGQFYLKPTDAMYKAARDAMNGWDPTYGCVYYYNPKTATNKWIKSLPIIIRIGNHVFSKG